MAKSDLDQFYTTSKCAERCFEALLAKLPIAETEAHFIEPSAGDGAFYDLLPKHRRCGIDMVPRHKNVRQADFLEWRPRRGRRANRVVVGNPPFGKRGDMAARFLCRAAEMADTIGFIVPMCFRKFAIQKKLPPDLRLVRQMRLRKTDFRLPDGSPYKINTEFQIWTRGEGGQDLRRTAPEPIRHPHFVMHQYNNTKEALVVFEKEFDFAVPCQGWQDYTRKETDPDACEKNKQWMLLRGLTRRYRRNLERIDYKRLAMRTPTMVPGFRKCDLVMEYLKRHQERRLA